MFNADTARTKTDQAYEDTTDTTAELLEEIGKRKAHKALAEFNKILADEERLDALLNGTGGSSSSTPAVALGAGSSGTSGNAPSPTDPKAQVAQGLSDMGVSRGQLQAVLRIISEPGDPGHMEVEDNGTPTELSSVTAELRTTKAECDKAEQQLASHQDKTVRGSLAQQLEESQQQLANEKDKTVRGSLAQQLEESQQQLASATSGHGLSSDKTEAARQHLDIVKTKADALTTSTFSNKIDGLDGLYDAIDKVEKELNS